MNTQQAAACIRIRHPALLAETRCDLESALRLLALSDFSLAGTTAPQLAARAHVARRLMTGEVIASANGTRLEVLPEYRAERTAAEIAHAEWSARVVAGAYPSPANV